MNPILQLNIGKTLSDTSVSPQTLNHSLDTLSQFINTEKILIHPQSTNSSIRISMLVECSFTSPQATAGVEFLEVTIIRNTEPEPILRFPVPISPFVSSGAISNFQFNASFNFIDATPRLNTPLGNPIEYQIGFRAVNFQPNQIVTLEFLNLLDFQEIFSTVNFSLPGLAF